MMDPSLWELYEAGDDGDEVAAIIRLGQPGVVPSGVRVIAQFGDIATCRVRRGALLEVRADAEVASLKAPGLLIPEDEVEPELPIEDFVERYEWVDERRPPDLPYEGNGVVIGVVDWGFDFVHPEFRNEDGSTRLLALWDQRPLRATANTYGYGVIHTQETINRALATADPYEALGYHPADADAGRGAHGTHVLSIAAGNGRGEGPVGIAPRADLICVHMASLSQQHSARLGDSVSLLEAIDFITKLASAQPPVIPASSSDRSSVGRSCVINLSMGRHGQPHDGTTLVEQGLDAALREHPGIAIVQSAGNYHQRRIHACGQLRPTESRHLIWEVFDADFVPNELEIWYSGRDSMRIEVYSPSGDLAAQANLEERVPIQLAGERVGSLYNRAHEPNSLDNHVQIFLYRSAPAGEWEIIIKAENVVDGRYHCWIEREPTRPDKQSRFRPEDADSTYTTGTICNGLRTIAVGAYNGHAPDVEIASFSSEGPTRDGRVKPDLCAPGVYVLAARSTTKDGDSALHTRMSGTSMASPHVAGAIALMFEAASRPLRIEETRNLLLASTQKIGNSGDLLNRIGSGLLNIREAVNTVKGIPTESPATRYQHAELQMQQTAASDQMPEEHSGGTASETSEQGEIMDNLEHDREIDAVETPDDERAADIPIQAADIVFDSGTDVDVWETPEHIPVMEFESLMSSYNYSTESFDTDEHCDSEALEETFSRLVEIADAVVNERRVGRNSRLFLHEVLSRAGISDLLVTIDPARIFDAFSYGRDPVLLGQLEGIFETIALPLARLAQQLIAGDILIRRGDGGFAHIAVIAQSETLPLRLLSERGLRPEIQLPGNYAQVVEAGARPHNLASSFARRITEPNNHLPYDQLILRVRGQQATPDVWEMTEAISRRSPEYVRWIQSSLNQIIQAGLQVDGIIGPLTRAATRAFQRQHPPLVVDGIVGPRTEAVMIAAGASPPPGSVDVPVIPPIPQPFIPPVIPPPGVTLNPARWSPILSGSTSASARVRAGNAVTFLVDGLDTFRAMVNAIRAAQSSEHYIYLLGWILKDNFELIPGDPSSTVHRLFGDASNRGVQIRVILWDQVGRANSAEVGRINTLATGGAILDNLTPNPIVAFGSHHQKVLIVKNGAGLVTFCGGIDINDDRISVVTAGKGEPLHDDHCRIMGPSAFDLLHTFIQRWDHHPEGTRIDTRKGALLGRSEPVPAPIASPSTSISSTGRTTSVCIARTFNPVSPGSTIPRQRDIQNLLIASIRNANRFIYMEDQYLIHPLAASELRAAIPRIQHLTIVMTASEILSGSSDLGTGGLPCVWKLRREFIARLTAGLSATDRAKVRIFVLVTPPPRTPPVFSRHTYVHAKSWIFDDELAVIGSANCNRRGWTHDSEVNAFIFDDAFEMGGQTFAQAYRMHLWSEHLTVPTSAVVDGVASAALWLTPPPTAHIMPYNPTANTDLLPDRVCDATIDTIDPTI